MRLVNKPDVKALTHYSNHGGLIHASQFTLTRRLRVRIPLDHVLFECEKLSAGAREEAQTRIYQKTRAAGGRESKACDEMEKRSKRFNQRPKEAHKSSLKHLFRNFGGDSQVS